MNNPIRRGPKCHSKEGKKIPIRVSVAPEVRRVLAEESARTGASQAVIVEKAITHYVTSPKGAKPEK
jgi:predicted DNA-binding protein